MRRVVLLYAVFAGLWISLSEAAVTWLFADPAQRALAGTAEGWVFVGVTAALLYGLVRRLVDAQRQAFASERTALQAHDHTQHLLQALAQSSPDAIFAKDREGRYLLFNREAARLAGQDAGAVLGRDDRAIFPAEQAAMIRANDERVMAQDRPETFEEEVDTADGRVTFLATKGPLHDAEGRMIGMFGISHDVTQRRELERQREAARTQAIAARDLLRDVLARVDDGFVALDRDWHYTYLNMQAARMLGREKPEDLLGRHIWTEFPEGVDQPFHRAYEQAMATQQPVVLEDHYAPWDRWFENRIYPSPDGLSVYFSDITLRKHAELALRAREERLRLSELRYRLAATGGQVWDWDAASGQVDFPAAFWRQLGYAPPAPQEVLERFQSLLHPDDVSRWRDALRQHLARRAPYELEYRARHADGEWRWFHTQGQAVWDAGGRATYLAGTTFDITQRKRAEGELRASDAYRSNVLEQLADGVLLIDRELRIKGANRQALLMLGYEHDELLRLTVHDVLPEFERSRAELEAAAVMGGRQHLAEWELRRSDGSLVHVEASARVLDDVHFVAVLRDMTDRHEAARVALTYQLELSELTQRLLAQEKTTTQRVAQALHDHLGQTLGVARLNLDACLATHAAAMPDALKEQGGRVAMLLDQAVREVRQVLADLRPPLLEDQGLAPALDNEIRSRVLVAGGADVLLEVADGVFDQRWPANVEYSAFMVAREAIANALQHAGATLVRVMLDGDASRMMLDIVDDGAGIAAPMARGRPGHLGIVGMRERAIAIGAHFAVDRHAGGGTRVSLRWEAKRP